MASKAKHMIESAMIENVNDGTDEQLARKLAAVPQLHRSTARRIIDNRPFENQTLMVERINALANQLNEKIGKKLLPYLGVTLPSGATHGQTAECRVRPRALWIVDRCAVVGVGWLRGWIGFRDRHRVAVRGLRAREPLHGQVSAGGRVRRLVDVLAAATWRSGNAQPSSSERAALRPLPASQLKSQPCGPVPPDGTWDMRKGSWISHHGLPLFEDESESDDDDDGVSVCAFPLAGSS